jgi:hypothetical protein
MIWSQCGSVKDGGTQIVPLRGHGIELQQVCSIESLDLHRRLY